MKTALFVFALFGFHICWSQDSAVVISAKHFNTEQLVLLAPLDGWIFKKGNDLSWANKDLDARGWKKLKPTEISSKLADEGGRVEGWFRLRLKLDKGFSGIPLVVRRGCWAATDIYLDGNLVATFGNTGENNKSFQEYNPIDKPSVAIELQVEKEHLIAIHFVDYLSPITPWKLKSEMLGGVRDETSQGLSFLIVLRSSSLDATAHKLVSESLFYRTSWFTVTGLLAFLFWLLFFQNPTEKGNIRLFAIYSTISAISNLCRFPLTNPDISFTAHAVIYLLQELCLWMILVATFIITTTILNFKLTRMARQFLTACTFFGTLTIPFDFNGTLFSVSTILACFGILYILISSRSKLKGAKWAIAAGILLSVLFGAIMAGAYILGQGFRSFSLFTSFYLSFPLSLVVYVSMRFKEMIISVQENAAQVVRMTEEKEAQAINQQKILKQEVIRQTAELRTALSNLKSTQSQLIQSEKMASLGELTAGIAHEIQNPLNFVNNFSEVSNELIKEIQDIRRKTQDQRDEKLEEEILTDISNNLEKINHHGKRAGDIVKSMLQHSRKSTGKKELTDINALCDEYLRLSYHGLRAKDKSFNAKFETDFDSSIPKINVIPQDIGRVMLNLINNAFYAVSEKSKLLASGQQPSANNYQPTVTVTTKKMGEKIEITVADNGPGISDSIKEKIFQPFFTTKPTGQGTGLGLSLSFDIVKAHGGELKVETKEGEGSQIIFVIPIQS